MKQKQFFSALLMVLLTVVLLSTIWEFWLEDQPSMLLHVIRGTLGAAIVRTDCTLNGEPSPMKMIRS